MYTVGVGWGYQPIEKTGNLDELIDKSEDIWDLPSGACVQWQGIDRDQLVKSPVKAFLGISESLIGFL